MKIKKIINGFTLMETVIYMTIFSTLLIVLSTLFSAIIDKQFGNRAKSVLDSDYFYISSRVRYEGLNAQKILTPIQIGESTQLVAYEANSKTRILRARNNNLELVIDGGTYVLNSQATEFSNASFKRKGNINGRQIIEISATLNPKNKSKTTAPIPINLIFATL